MSYENKNILVSLCLGKEFTQFFSFSFAESKPILEDTTFGVAQNLPSSGNIYICVTCNFIYF